jgi:hypothetical protein
MPESWYKITRPLNLSGFETDGFNDDAQDSFDELLGSFLGRSVEIYEKRMDIPGAAARAIIQNVTPDSVNSASIRQILCLMGTLRCGQYVVEGANTWLVCSLPDNNGIYEKAIMWHCKHSIRFESPLTGDVVEYPVYSINSTQYGTGESPRDMMTVPDSQRLIYLPYNEETVLLDNGARFLIDKNKAHPTAWRLTRVDSESYACGEDDGLLQWALIEDQTRGSDDTSGMVADESATKDWKGDW